MSKPLVYFADDDEVIIKVIEQRFKSYGCNVRSFSSAQKLYDALVEKTPALVMIDLNLQEGLVGFEIIRTLREKWRSQIPIIILSGEQETSRIAHGIELGANDYIVKPPMRLDFEEIIGKHLKAERLPEATPGIFQPISHKKRKAKFTFPIRIEEVLPTGLTLASDHLINKGTSFYLKGPELKKILPNCEQLFVTVINSAAKTVEHRKFYSLSVEIDSAQEATLNQLKKFLDQKMVAAQGAAKP